MKAPELILNPKGGASDWIILLQGEKIEPESRETGYAVERAIVHQPCIVVPDEAIAKRWQIGQHGKGDEKSCFGGSPHACGSKSRHLDVVARNSTMDAWHESGM